MSARRGQAVVELALGTLVFVTILLFGIQFAEIGALKLRVQQAGNFALWNATAMRAHNLYSAAGYSQPPVFLDASQLVDGTGKSPAQAAQLRYQDFDGVGTGASIKLTLAGAGNLKVTCNPAAVANIVNTGSTAWQSLQPGYQYARFGGRDVDGMECNAQATIDLLGGALAMPTHFLDDAAGFFGAPHAVNTQLTVCAFGRAHNGMCNGALPVAIDDWGLAGNSGTYGQESAECDILCAQFMNQGNMAYHQTVHRLYARWMNAHSPVPNTVLWDWMQKQFVNTPPLPGGWPWLDAVYDPSIMTFAPVDERFFRMMFLGEEGSAQTKTPFSEQTQEVSEGAFGNTWPASGPTAVINQDWALTPYTTKYQSAYQNRDECFLGIKCSTSPFDKVLW
jgi:hypothetical protein